MGSKSKAGKQKGYVSKGQVPTVNKKLANAVRRDKVGTIDRLQRQYDAFMKGKNVVVTIPNPTNSTKERYIKVNGAELWGNWRERSRGYVIKTKSEEII